jgi:hypothetical protein
MRIRTYMQQTIHGSTSNTSMPFTSPSHYIYLLHDVAGRVPRAQGLRRLPHDLRANVPNPYADQPLRVSLVQRGPRVVSRCQGNAVERLQELEQPLVRLLPMAKRE